MQIEATRGNPVIAGEIPVKMLRLVYLFAIAVHGHPVTLIHRSGC